MGVSDVSSLGWGEAGFRVWSQELRVRGSGRRIRA